MPDTAENIAQTIDNVWAVISPIVKDLNPMVGKGVEIAFKVLATVEPGAYRAIASLIASQGITPDQQAEIDAVCQKLKNPESYFA